jgi:hypothetical protein
LAGYFGNQTEAHVESYLRNAAGGTVYSGLREHQRLRL